MTIQDVSLAIICLVSLFAVYPIYLLMEDKYYHKLLKKKMGQRALVDVFRNDDWRNEFSESELVIIQEWFEATLSHVNNPSKSTLADLTIIIQKVEPIMTE